VDIRDLLSRFDIRLNKRLGQHFLYDEVQIRRIIDAGDIGKNDLVLEIGTGIGTLTKPLAEKAGLVVTVEIDKRLIPAAREYLKDQRNIDLIESDFMDLDIKKLLNKYKKYKNRKVVANLPYYITSPIISKLIDSKLFDTMILTIQKEVAERIIAKPGTKDYSSFSIYVNFHAKPEVVSYIPRSSFIPQPVVGSAILKLHILDKPSVKVKSKMLFFKLVHAAFQQRRKMLKNAIENAGLKWPEIPEIDGKRRGETLSINEFAKLANSF